MSQSVEYGVNTNYSVFIKALLQKQKSFAKHVRSNFGFELATKIKIKQTAKYIVSLQPTMTIYQRFAAEDEVSGALGLLLGSAGKYKFGKTFHAVEFMPAISKNAWQCNLQYTSGIETQHGTVLMLQTDNSFRPKANKLYRQTSIERLSIAKPVHISNHAQHITMTLQLGYFNELSVSARRSLTSGVQCAIWIQI
jgi:hypothetical protein